MALADFAAYKAMLAKPKDISFFNKTTSSLFPSSAASIPFASVRNRTYLPEPSADPTTAAALDNSSVGGLFHSAHSGRMVIASVSPSQRVDIPVDFVGPTPAMLLIDALSHQGGLSMNTASEQTTNLPTAALTRYTDGVGVMIGVHVISGGNSTDFTLTASYTDQDGNAGQTATVYVTDTPSLGSFYIAQLAAGDTGARSVESVTVSVATGSAGNLSIVLFKPLAIIPRCYGGRLLAHEIPGWNTGIHTDAHLELLFVPSQFNIGGQYAGALQFAEV